MVPKSPTQSTQLNKQIAIPCPQHEPLRKLECLLGPGGDSPEFNVPALTRKATFVREVPTPTSRVWETQLEAPELLPERRGGRVRRSLLKEHLLN